MDQRKKRDCSHRGASEGSLLTEKRRGLQVGGRRPAEVGTGPGRGMGQRGGTLAGGQEQSVRGQSRTPPPKDGSMHGRAEPCDGEQEDLSGTRASAIRGKMIWGDKKSPLSSTSGWVFPRHIKPQTEQSCPSGRCLLTAFTTFRLQLKNINLPQMCTCSCFSPWGKLCAICVPSSPQSPGRHSAYR